MKNTYVAPKIEVHHIQLEESISSTSNIRIQQTSEYGWLEEWEESEIILGEYEFKNNL